MSFTRNLLLIISVFITMSASGAEKLKADWSKVIEAIIHVESRGDYKAKSGCYVGAMQIAPILVKECNMILEEKKSKLRYTLNDRYDVKKSMEMFLLFQQKYNPTNNVEWAIRAWNGGPRFSKKATDGYYNRVLTALKD